MRTLRWAVFCVLGVLYVAIVLARLPKTLEADEARYTMFASHLANGYYSPPGETRLDNGPGYPVVLLPFQLLGEFWLGARLLNVLFLLGAVVLVERTLRRFVSDRAAIVGAGAYGLFPPAAAFLPLMMTEPLAQFLVAALAAIVCRAIDDDNCKVWLAGGLVAGFLAMVKVIFGLVTLVILALLGTVFAVRRNAATLRLVKLFAVAFVCCLPYLTYTYSLTGRPFYWSTVGGSSLYWMASPYEGETGDWHGTDLDQLEENARRRDRQLLDNHGDFFRSLEGLDRVASNDRFKEQWRQWICDHPGKWLSNWVHNQGRLWLGMPYSFSTQRISKLATVVPGAILIFLLILAFGCALRWPRAVCTGPLVLITFAAIGIAGTSLLSAHNRYLEPFLPLIFLWIFSILGTCVRFECIHDE